ncbi:MAG: DUF3224 domain-containing protein [Gemmatimonadaceae bacterium]
MHAHGLFDVKLAPLDPAHGGEGALGRMSIDKQYRGDLTATGAGEMLSFMSAAPGSGAYVALERVVGTLQGRSGTFVLQHSATMTRGAPHLSLTVAPDSGTGELSGLAGSMQIIIDGKKHSYEFDYELGGAP